RDRLDVHQEVDEVAVAGVRRHAAGRGMRLAQIAQVGQLGELAPDRRRGEVDEGPALQRLRADWNGARRALLDYRPEDGLLPVFHVFSTPRWRVPTTLQQGPQAFVQDPLL